MAQDEDGPVRSVDLTRSLTTLRGRAEEAVVEDRGRPEVHRALDRFDKNVALLAEIIEDIDGRLTPILNPNRLMDGRAETDEDRPSRSPMADRIDSLCDHMEVSIARLRAIHSATEV